VNSRKRQPSMSGLNPRPQFTPSMSLAMMALSFTLIAIPVQAAAQGSARDLLPILIATILAMAGATHPRHPGAYRDVLFPGEAGYRLVAVGPARVFE
jgi:hypothetical protein